jgi:hypothetical protein
MSSSSKSANVRQVNPYTFFLHVVGQEHWVQRRVDLVDVKGKGVLDSFWIDVTSTGDAPEASAAEVSLSSPIQSTDGAIDADKVERLIKWMTDLFIRRIETIVARQNPKKVGKCSPASLVYKVPEGKTSLDEVAEIIRYVQVNGWITAWMDPASTNF